MNILAWARRLLISFVCVFMAFLLLAGSFPALASQAENTGELPVAKRWEREGNLPENSASAGPLRLAAAGAQADGSRQDRPIDYTVTEEPLEAYVFSMMAAALLGLLIRGWIKRS